VLKRSHNKDMFFSEFTDGFYSEITQNAGPSQKVLANCTSLSHHLAS